MDDGDGYDEDDEEEEEVGAAQGLAYKSQTGQY